MSDTTPVPRAGGQDISVLGTTLLPSVLRTLVPIIYALLVRKGVVEWLGFEDVLVNNAITLVVTGLFYVVLRLLERYKAQVGWLLGYAQQPVYVKGEVLSVTEQSTPPTTTTVVEADKDSSGTD